MFGQACQQRELVTLGEMPAIDDSTGKAMSDGLPSVASVGWRLAVAG